MKMTSFLPSFLQPANRSYGDGCADPEVLDRFHVFPDSVPPRRGGSFWARLFKPEAPKSYETPAKIPKPNWLDIFEYEEH